MDSRIKTPLIIAGIAVAAYLAYRWWQNRQSGGSPTGAFGTNLNSVAPELIGGSSGPDSGLNYTPPSVTVNYPQTITTSVAPPANPVGGTPSTNFVTGTPKVFPPNFGGA